MARIKHVKKSRKPLVCGRCKIELPVGSEYRWWKLYRGRKRVRCTKPKCAPRSSELTQGKYGQVYAAQEELDDVLTEFEKTVAKWDWDKEGPPNLDDLRSSVEDAVSEIQDVAEEYEEGAGNIEESFPDSEKVEQMRECAEGLNEYADELGDCLGSIDEKPEDKDSTDDWVAEASGAVRDALQSELPDAPGY